MPAPDTIHRLVDQFRRSRAVYSSSKYNETLLRQEFLNPFFKALGWDIDNVKGFALQYREVIHEDRVDVDGSTKAPDYAFRIGGVRKFFVEAKKPAEDIEGDAALAYQLRRYAWNAHLPLSILTDFEEFAVYDCRNRPSPGDSPATSRIMLLRYEDYEEQWDEIASIFSPDAILKGAFDRYAEDNTGRKGTIKVDDAFLADIEEWRTSLARNIALRNPQVADERQLNFAVQMIIDRIIFLRICEDRKIEPENQLREISEADGIYPALVALFERSDLRYNSGLFHFRKEKGRADSADSLTPKLNIDDKVLKGIVRDLYYPSPYIFNEIPVEILGQVYEQFLGKVIRLTAGHHARVEEKPEVRKAGGVYYTPKYIVDYIVEHTVGKLLEGKTPKEAAQLKVVDPACGSGSFLLGAFQRLLDWHERWYLEHDPAQWAQGTDAALAPAAAGGWRLSTAEKKRILLNNIFGVDIDAQAVEVTKLSLLLKVLEGETGQLSLGFERVLPDLGANIQCGNSLIGPDYYEGKQLGLFNADEMYRINAFDWEQAFPEVFTQGGFDAVIGNPPYIRIQAMREWAPVEVEHYKEKYISASKGNYDIYVVFVEKGLSLLNKQGRLGFILPHKFFNAKYGEPVRQVITDGNHLVQIVHFRENQVFEDATTYTCLLFLTKRPQKEILYIDVDDLNEWKNNSESVVNVVSQELISSTNWYFISNKQRKIFDRINKNETLLGDISLRIFQGLKTGADSVFILESTENGKLFSKELEKIISIEPTYLKPLYKSGEFKRYNLIDNSRFVIFPYENGRLLPWSVILLKSPKLAHYLEECKQTLIQREKGKFKGRNWYCFSRNQALEIISNPKILTADLNPHANYCFDESGEVFFPGGAAGGYGILLEERDYLYILGLLNSKVIDYYHKLISTNFRGGWFGYDAKVIRNIPIRVIDFSSQKEEGVFERMNDLVRNMIDIQKKINISTTPTEKTQLQRQIDATDAEIDRLVYELYGLTDEEIRIVEESVRQ